MENKLSRWEDRSIIAANLLNPAFCGEVLRRTIKSYNENESEDLIQYSLLCLVLPIVLHKHTREKMPIRSTTYFHSWVDSNEALFINFGARVRQILPYTNETLMFLLNHEVIRINKQGKFELFRPVRNNNKYTKESDEIKQILKKSELLGKWFKNTGNPQTIYMFLKIQP